MIDYSRRNVLALAGLGAITLAASPVLAASAGTGSSFSMIQVDTSSLKSDNYGAQAQWVQKDLSRALAKQFPNRGGRSAPRLIVQIDSLSLGDYADGNDPGTDYLYGQALVVANDKDILASYPIKLSLPPSEAGPWYLANIDRLRVTSLCNAFAGWVARYVH